MKNTKYSLVELILNEYSDKVVNQMTALYKSQTDDSEEQIKQNIKDHNRLRDSIATKLQQNNPAVSRAIPQELQQNNRFKDITLIKDYNTLVRMLKAVSKKDTDIYKQAIEYFKKKDQYMDPSIIGMYVGQFKKNKDNIEQAVKEKNELVISLLPSNLANSDKASDILSYKNFEDLEKLIDGAFPFEGKEKGEINSAETDADKIYENPNDGIEIYKGDAEHKCIKYGKSQYYSWCIARTKGSLYANYRFMQSQGKNRMFYFVIDRTQTDAKEGARFVNPYHVVVIHALENKKYTRTTANNDGDIPYEGADWNELGKYFEGENGQRMWNKIKGLQKYFPFVPPSSEERKLKGFKGQRLTLDDFIDLEADDKQAWLRANASDRNLVNPQIVKSLDNEQINDLINYNRQFSFDELKKSQGLLKRYADYRFTRFPKEPLPYVFIPYLKPDLQLKYLDQFGDDYITFPILEKYFSEDVIKNYVTKELNSFSVNLPPEAKKYMSNDQKTTYDAYSLAFKDATSTTEGEVDENSTVAPVQYISLPAISQESYASLDPNDRKKLNDLYNNLKNDSNNLTKYSNFFTAYPTVFELNNKSYLVTPAKKDSVDDLVIMDEDGNIVKDNITQVEFLKGNKEVLPNDSTFRVHGNKSAYLAPDDYDQVRIVDSNFDIKTLTPLQLKIILSNYLQEALVNKHMMRQLKYRAGIIK
jgi:hypothetical protein